MVILIKALQVLLALSVLIFVHELGHFMWAKIFRIRVEKFYLFFDAGGKALARWKWGGTEFGIGWLPFGGYCKISGMVDESMDTEQMQSEPKEWEFRTHPAWQRLLVLAGGVLNNFIFAILAYAAIMAIWGQAVIDNRSNSIYVNDLAYEMGFRNGDRILSFDDYEPEDFSMLQADLARRDVSSAKVLRGADTVTLYIDRSMISEVLNSPLMFDLAVPFVVDSVWAEGPNPASGLRRGDRIISLNGEKVEFLQDSRPVLESHRESTVNASVVRGADTLDIPVKVDSSGRIGIYAATPGEATFAFTGDADLAAAYLLRDNSTGMTYDLADTLRFDGVGTSANRFELVSRASLDGNEGQTTGEPVVYLIARDGMIRVLSHQADIATVAVYDAAGRLLRRVDCGQVAEAEVPADRQGALVVAVRLSDGSEHAYRVMLP